MSDAVGYEVSEGVAILTIENPPVNAVGAAVRQGLLKGLRRAVGDDGVAAILIIGGGRTFPAGSDIGEFGKRPADPWLPGLCNEIEAAPKPVIAAIHGMALGGGLELALAAHYRIAHEGARIGFPEVTLGIVPGAGGTQRAPRLGGAENALDLMLSGRRVDVTSPEAAPYIDAIVEGDLRQGAMHYIRALLAEGLGTRPTGARREGFAEPEAYQQEIARRRAEAETQPVEAQREIVRCVEAAALLPFDTGLTLERAAFDDCVQSDQAASLRHMFFAERRAAKFPETDGKSGARVAQVGIVGGGKSGRGLIMACLAAGLEVVLVERNGPALRESLGTVQANLERDLSRGRITQQARDERMARLTGQTDYVAVSEADIVIEAVADDLREKERVLFQLDAVAREGAVLVTTTKRHDVGALAEHTDEPGWVLGLDIAVPAHRQKVGEILVPDGADPVAVAALVGFLRQIGKTPVRAGGGKAHIGRAVVGACLHAASLLVEDGSTPYLVDAAMRAYGMALGPFERLDRDGLAENGALRQAMMGHTMPQGREIEIAERLCEAGRLGKASGKGYYLYDAQTPQGRQDAEVIRLIRAERERKGIRARGVSESDIQRHCLAAMVNEGARLLRLGVVRCPSDIDVVMVNGFGFPRWRGGPMKAADLVGVLNIQRDIESFAAQDRVFWSPEPVFDRLFKAGEGFDGLNA